MTVSNSLRCAALMALAALAAIPLGAMAANNTALAEPALIPAPASMQRHAGNFLVGPTTPVRALDPQARAAADQFASLVARTHALQLKVQEAGGDHKGAIDFRIDPEAAGANPESYTLDADPQRIVVSARDPRGLFYGAVTLWQLLTTDAKNDLSIAAVHIDDTPRFAWRGLMLDSARHFQTVDEIKQLLDAMALHKLNTFHWHLTDDQGWRIEIKRYPKLAAVGGCRIPAGDGGVGNDGKPRPYCGYYTQDQIRDVVRYAAQRHITIVPEINAPGHAQAAVAAYPELGVTGKQVHVLNEWGVNTTLFNVEESTFQFLENVLAEVVELFPGTYVHVGGDEAVKDQWKASARVQERIKELGVKDEAGMQSYLVKRLEKFLVAHHKRLIGWDEILEGGLPEEATVMSWRGIEGGIVAANQGHDVVMSPSDKLYLDYLQTDSPNEPPGRPATITLEQVYAFEPVPAALAADKRAHILGLQANVWTEHMRSFARVEHAIFPRIAALAETAWSPQDKKDWEGFVARLPAQLQRYRAMDIAYAQTPFEVRSALIEDRKQGTVQVSLSNQLGYADMRYTTDGSDPTAASKQYSAPFELKLPAELRATVFVDGQALATPTLRTIDAASLLTRSDEELAMCTGALMLRLEDDGPAEGERAIFNADIFNPCWEWKAADLDGIASITVRAGRMPYYFQLAHDESHRKFKPAKSVHGELEIRAGCEGPVLATVPMPAATAADGFVDLRTELKPTSGPQDLCIYFTGDTRPAMWVLDRATLGR
ncbi:family 20 glycosylhydrolase [Pseudoxanthomonas yeongjuensis]|uniref:family 20 glycosylhydrolase n=1 Tax=Pseudoxanthomonas yeongjuensis TaxID=377616 RepID=UPI003CCE2A03